MRVRAPRVVRMSLLLALACVLVVSVMRGGASLLILVVIAFVTLAVDCRLVANVESATEHAQSAGAIPPRRWYGCRNVRVLICVFADLSS